MNEIEKMYANAKVKPFRYCYNCVDNNGNRIENSANCPSRPYCINTCDNPEYEFTAEKQLSITKLFGLRYGLKFITSYGYDYGEAIANLVNNLWQDLTPEEKQQIKEILSE